MAFPESESVTYRTPEYTVSHYPRLPSAVMDRFRHRVDLTGPRWRLHIVGLNAVINWDSLTLIQGVLLHCFKLYVVDTIERCSPVEARNVFWRVKVSLSSLGDPMATFHDLTEVYFRSLRSVLRDQGREWLLNPVRAWYLWMRDQDFPGVCSELALELESWSIPGNAKGEAVMSHDSSQGPLTEDEFTTLWRAVKRQEPGHMDAIVVSLCIELGSNPKNLLLLEERDFHKFVEPSQGKTFYQIAIPRIKKRQDFRDAKPRSICEELGRSIEKLMALNRERLGGEDLKRPILCRQVSVESLVGTPMERFRFHLTIHDIAACLKRFARDHQVISPRTGEILYLTPRRLRYTFATRMAEQGAPPMILAELLDHTDLQNITVYYKSSPKIADRLERALADKAGPVWKKFLGEVVDSSQTHDPAKAIYGSTPTLRHLGGMGSCGKNSFCNLYPPLSCYVCSHFQAWKDAPHEQMLEELKEHRKTLAELANNNPSNRIPYQLDEVIIAVEELVLQCQSQ